MADHKRKKKRGRSKLFRSCFRSFAADERPFSNDKSDRRNSKSGRLGKPVFIAVSGRKAEDFIPDVSLVNAGVNGSGDDLPGERCSRGGRISRLFKAVLFQSVMAKKICSSSKSSIDSDTGESFLSIENSPPEDSNASCTEATDVEDSSSRCSNLLSSSSRTTSSSYASSSSSSTNSNSRWLSDPTTSSPVNSTDANHPILSNSLSLQKPNLINSSSRSCSSSAQTDSILLSRQDTSISLPLAKSNSLTRSSSYHKGLSQSNPVDSSDLVSPNCEKIKSACNNRNIRWCLFLLLSLVVLVIYGRIYSILCTSAWLYLVPSRRVKRVNSVTNTAGFTDTESEQYKKRVIMAGLLDRTRNPLR